MAGNASGLRTEDLQIQFSKYKKLKDSQVLGNEIDSMNRDGYDMRGI